MPAVVAGVEPKSIAEEVGIEKGDIILKINDQPLRDIIDYRYLESDEELTLHVKKPNGEEWLVEVEKDLDEHLGIEFVSPLFDKIKRCANHCVFCFIDQMPCGMRQTLYTKDDDYRLSFLTGNFVTLTNMREEDWDRILRYRLSPLYVSVHTTDPELRCRILGNRRAGKIMAQLQRLVDAGIRVNCQIVCVPGLNDGEVLTNTLDDLSQLWPGVQSIAIVPVGLTQYRSELVELEPWDAAKARNLLAIVEGFQKGNLEKYGSRLVWAADEFYLMAEAEIPKASSYEEFQHLENGIGLTALFREQFWEKEPCLPEHVCGERRVSFVTSVLGYKAMAPIIRRLEQVRGLYIRVIVVENRFFGSRITVSGLLVGADIKDALMQIPTEKRGDIWIPAVALNDRAAFLDDMTLDTLAAELGNRVIPIGTGDEVVTRVCEYA